MLIYKVGILALIFGQHLLMPHNIREEDGRGQGMSHDLYMVYHSQAWSE